MLRLVMSAAMAALCCFVVPQAGSETFVFIDPLYEGGDELARGASGVIRAELLKATLEGRLGVVKEADHSADTALLRAYNEEQLERDAQGFVTFGSVLRVAPQAGLAADRFLLVYDLHVHDLSGGEEGNPVRLPAVLPIPVPGGIAIVDLGGGGVAAVNEYDTLAFRASVYDLAGGGTLTNQEFFFTDDSCDEVLDCALEALMGLAQSYGPRAGPVITAHAVRRVTSPQGTLILCGVLSAVGGVALLVPTIINGGHPPPLIGIGVVLLVGSAPLGIVGTIRQIKYRAWEKSLTPPAVR